MPLLVAAIDFGTTFSGWAFSFAHEFERDPIRVSAKQWTGGQLVSMKGPTCILIKPDGKTLDSFGYDAESKYGELALEECHKQYYYFKRFKMLLFGKIGMERNILIEDASGKKLLARTVFALSIKFLRDDLLEMSKNRITGDGLSDDDIHWVLTVPAIWNDAAKQFMREAAQEAGIPGKMLTIALEPEVASLYCRHLPVEKCLGPVKTSLAKFNSGTKYLVLDAGGGTVDITVHEVMPNGNLKELHKASGGAWGGTKVDDAFERFLVDLIGGCGKKKSQSMTGTNIMTKFKQEHMDDYIELFRDFEIKKRDVSPLKDAKITFRVPATLSDAISRHTGGKSLKEILPLTKYKEKITLISDKLRIESDVVKAFFTESTQSVLKHVRELLGETSVQGCSAIIMVGGFSESPMLQENVRKCFSQMKIIIPDEAGLAVLKGAVIFGHSPRAIAERVCKFTYGDRTSHASSPNCTHPPARRGIDANGMMRCYDMFTIHVRVGQAVRLGEEQQETISMPVTDTQTSVGFDIYASSSVSPIFVTEKSCSKIGHFDVEIPDTSLGRARKFGCSFIFGGTEIEVKVVDKATRKVTRKSVDFLG